MAKKIQRSFFRYQQLKSLRRLFKSIKRIQTLFRVQNEYKKFRDTQKKIRYLQRSVKHRIFKKKLEEFFEKIKSQKSAVTKISAFYKMKIASRRFESQKAAANFIKNSFLAYQKNKKRKLFSFCFDLFRKEIFEKAWKKIKMKIETAAVIIIQKFFRMFLTQKKFRSIVNKIKKKRFSPFFLQINYYFKILNNYFYF